MNPKIIKKGTLKIAGISGDGDKTWEVWNTFEKQKIENPITNRLSDNGHEIRTFEGEKSFVHVGFEVSDEAVNAPYTLYTLPASQYASFDVYVAQGYESENNAMNEWLATNEEGYVERLQGDKHYCVEYYDERFNGNEEGSIVEIWIPIERK